MPTPRISVDQKDSIFFITLTIQRWFYLFDRYERWTILLNALKHYQKHNNLKIYSWVFMLNHMHIIFQCKDAIKFVNGFKSYTAQKLRENIEETEPHLLNLFKTDNDYHIWQDNNFPEIVESENFFLQKVNYIIENPVRKEYVNYPEDWRYSSASKIQLIELSELL